MSLSPHTVILFNLLYDPLALLSLLAISGCMDMSVEHMLPRYYTQVYQELLVHRVGCQDTCISTWNCDRAKAKSRVEEMNMQDGTESDNLSCQADTQRQYNNRIGSLAKAIQ